MVNLLEKEMKLYKFYGLFLLLFQVVLKQIQKSISTVNHKKKYRDLIHINLIMIEKKT